MAFYCLASGANVEKKDRETSAPSMRSNAPRTSEPVGAAGGAVKAQQRGMSFAAGEAVTTPNEAKGQRPKGQVDLGGGPEVAALQDVPVGEARRLAQLADKSTTVANDREVWPRAALAASELMQSGRVAIEARYLAHREVKMNRPEFAENHAAIGVELVTHSIEYASAHAAYSVLGFTSRSTFDVVAIADRDFAKLTTELLASGHATRTDGRLVIDAPQLGAENTHFRQAAADDGNALLSGASRDSSGIEAALGALNGTARVLGATSIALRALDDMKLKKDADAELAAQEERADVADSVDEFVSVIDEIYSLGTSVVTLDPVSLTKTAFDVVKAIADGPRRAKLERARARVEACHELLDVAAKDSRLATVAAAMSNAIQQIEMLTRAIAAYGHKAEERQQELRVSAEKLDRDAREEGALGPSQERHAPIAERLGRFEAASSSGRLAQTGLTALRADVAVASKKRAILRDRPVTYPDVHDLRTKLTEDDLAGRLEERIDTIDAQLGARGEVIAASMPKEGGR